MDNVPVDSNRGASSAQNNSQKSNSNHGRKPSKKNIKKLIGGFLLIILVSGLVVLGLALVQSSTSATIDKNKYQAVFFTNGQVYFGKLQPVNGEYMKLNDIFYLQAKKTAVDPANPQATTPEETDDVELIKLGNEIHGPEDEMIISKEQILFYENLKTDGKVAQSISGYKAK